MTQKQKVSIGFAIFIFILLVVGLAFFVWKQQEEVITSVIPPSVIPPQGSYFEDWNVYEHDVSVFQDIPSFKIYYPKDWVIRAAPPDSVFDGIAFFPAPYEPPTLENPKFYFFLDLIYRWPNITNSREAIFDEAILRCAADGPMGSHYCLKESSSIEEFQNVFGIDGLKIIRKNIFITASGERKEWDDFVIVYELPETTSPKYRGIIFMADYPEYLDIMLLIANTLRF